MLVQFQSGHTRKGPVQEHNLIKWGRLRWLLFVKLDSKRKTYCTFADFSFFLLFPSGYAEQKEELADVPCKSTDCMATVTVLF